MTEVQSTWVSEMIRSSDVWKWCFKVKNTCFVKGTCQLWMCGNWAPECTSPSTTKSTDWPTPFRTTQPLSPCHPIYFLVFQVSSTTTIALSPSWHVFRSQWPPIIQCSDTTWHSPSSGLAVTGFGLISATEWVLVVTLSPCSPSPDRSAVEKLSRVSNFVHSSKQVAPKWRVRTRTTVHIKVMNFFLIIVLQNRTL